jgi:hypothetical protein
LAGGMVWNERTMTDETHAHPAASPRLAERQELAEIEEPAPARDG